MLSRRTAVSRVSTAILSCLLGINLGLAPEMAAAQVADPGVLRIIVPYPPGGGTDRTARLVAEALGPRLGQTVLVENVTGVGGRLAMRQFANATGESNLLLLANPALMVVAPLVFKNNGYDPDRDYQPVSAVTTYEMAAAVATAVPVRELNHMLAWLKANPKLASIGVPATGSLPHFFALMMTDQAKAQVEVIGYKGSAPLTTDLMGGHVPVAVDAFESLQPQHEAGKLRILATSGKQRSVPDIPTMREAGVNLTAEGWNVFVARSTMPADRVERIAREIASIMATPAMREKFLAQKATPISMGRIPSKALIDDFKKQWVPTIEKSGVKFD